MFSSWWRPFRQWLFRDNVLPCHERRHVRRRHRLRALLDVLQLEDRVVPSAYQWTGDSSTVWEDPGNWTGGPAGTYPSLAGDVAQFTGTYAAAQQVVVAVPITVGEIDFGTPQNVTISASGGNVLTLDNTGTAANAILNVGAGTFTNSGVNVVAAPISVKAATPLQALVGGGTLDVTNTSLATPNVVGNSSTFTVNSGGTLEGSADPTNPALGNAGIVLSGGTLQLDASANGAGTLANAIADAAGAASTLTATGQNALTLTGSLTLGDGATLTATAGLANAGSVTVGATGVLTVGGGYTQSGTGTLTFEIGSSGAGRLSATGGASLAGTANIRLVGGTVPVAGQTFQVLTANGLAGSFAAIGGLAAGNLSADFSGTALTLVCGAPADPATSIVTITPASVLTGGTATVLMQARDAGGGNLSGGGLSVAFALGAGTAGGTFGTVTDNDDGTYTATFTATTAGRNTITATIGGQAVASAVNITVTPASVSYNAAADFSPENNPNGVWSYGWTPTLGGSFAADTIHVDTNGQGLDRWQSSIGGDGNPQVVHNATGTDLSEAGTGVFLPANQLVQHPGPGGQYSIVRWTAPDEGFVLIAAVFTGADSVVGTTTDVHVLDDGTPLFDNEVTGFGNMASFASQPINVAQGDTIDVAVGYGSNANYFSDSTATDLTVNFMPGPFSLTQSTLSVGSPSVQAGGTTAVTLQARDWLGNPLSGGGLTVGFTLADGSGGGTFSDVQDNGDGTYTATLTATTAGSHTIQATIDGQPVPSTVGLTVTPGPVSLTHSTLSFGMSSLTLGGSTSVTLATFDAYGNPEPSGQYSVQFSVGAGTGSGTLQGLSAGADGTYVSSFAGTSVGTVTIMVTINGQPLASAVPALTVTKVNTGISRELKKLGTGVSQLGAALTGDLPALNGAVEQQYQNATIIYAASTGAHVLDSATASVYLASATQLDAKGNTVAKDLGLPTSNDSSTTLAGVTVVNFQGGKIYADAATGAHVLYGAIATEYAATARLKTTDGKNVQTSLGLLTADETPVPGIAGASVVHFQNGSIYQSPTTGAHVLLGAIDTAYTAAAQQLDANGNSVQKILGLPTGDATSIIIIGGVSGASMVHFQGGAVYASPTTGAHVLYGTIYTEYTTLAKQKDPSGNVVQQVIGLPTGDITNIAGAGTITFQGGTIYSSPATGAHVIYGAFAAAYTSAANQLTVLGENGGAMLGLPTSDPVKVATGFSQQYEGGTILWTASGGPKLLFGAFATEYAKTATEIDPRTGRSVQAILGSPTDIDTVPGIADAFVLNFPGGKIYYSPSTGAHVLYGAMEAEYDATAHQTDAFGHNVQALLGCPTNDEAAEPAGYDAFTPWGPYFAVGVSGARIVTFTRGTIYWSAATGAHVLLGAIATEYAAAEQEPTVTEGCIQSALGLPIGDEVDVPNVPGARMQAFQGGWIYWSNDTGAHAVIGANNDLYQKMGTAGSYLGLPTSDEGLLWNGGTQSLNSDQLFENGKILFTQKFGAYAIHGGLSRTFTRQHQFQRRHPGRRLGVDHDQRRRHLRHLRTSARLRLRELRCNGELWLRQSQRLPLVCRRQGAHGRHG